MLTRRGATTVTARRGPHLVGGSGAAVAGGGVSGLPRPLPPRSSHTKFVNERGLLRRLDLREKGFNFYGGRARRKEGRKNGTSFRAA